eukprot:gnl/Spiro4/22882_TR11287_c4_g4_i1.p1 gnl/Spiro4/22882_TR11287_c4_g4~~gnl/Spiro4/22882_TR11287_c4_g4_i1.p1  ORF type:complete len:295 (-),score=44.79 gnl/Spiro4/22882_TR11287_c4_g4_i1:308-1192(-)
MAHSFQISKSVRLSFLLGAWASSADLDRYALYFRLADTAYGCTIMGIFYQPFAGWIADNITTWLHTFMIFLASVQIFAEIVQLYGPSDINFQLIAYQFRQLCLMTSWTCVWKLTKIQVEFHFPGSLFEQDKTIGRVGSLGDMVCQVHEIFTLGLAFYMASQEQSTERYNIVKMFTCWSVIGAACVFLVLACTFTHRDVQPELYVSADPHERRRSKRTFRPTVPDDVDVGDAVVRVRYDVDVGDAVVRVRWAQVPTKFELNYNEDLSTYGDYDHDVDVGDAVVRVRCAQVHTRGR